MLPADLRLGNDELQRVRVVRLVNRVVQNADCLEKMANNASLAGEVARVREDGLALGLELHAAVLLAALLHSRLDPRYPAILIQDLVHVRVEHVRAAVDS